MFYKGTKGTKEAKIWLFAPKTADNNESKFQTGVDAAHVEDSPPKND